MNWQSLILLIAVTTLPCEVHAQVLEPSPSAQEKGREVATELSRRDEGFGDTTAELKMELVNAEGRSRTRKLRWKTLEVLEPGEGDKSLTIFQEPRDVEGTAFLSYTHIEGDDDQWLYLPSLKRVKRIAAANKSSAFVGSEFAYEDLLSDELERFDYLWLRDEACGNWQCSVVERRPRYQNSGYSRQIIWIDRNEYRPIRITYYDLKNRLLKTLTFQDYRQYLERFWRAQVMRMENHQTKKTTVLTFSDYQFQTGLTPRDFEPDALRRLR